MLSFNHYITFNHQVSKKTGLPSEILSSQLTDSPHEDSNLSLPLPTLHKVPNVRILNAQASRTGSNLSFYLSNHPKPYFQLG